MLCCAKRGLVALVMVEAAVVALMSLVLAVVVSLRFVVVTIVPPLRFVVMVVVMLCPDRKDVPKVAEPALACDAPAMTLRKRAERSGSVAVVVR